MFVPAETAGSKYFIKQLPGFADKWPAVSILIGTGSLTDQHDFGIKIAFPKNDLVSRLAETAFRAVQYFLF